MSQEFSVSEIGLKLIKTYEGFRSKDRTLLSGEKVVGYGHKMSEDDTMQLDRDAAEALLRADLAPFETMINDNIHAPLSQSQFDALVSLAFNIGPKAFLRSELVNAINNGRTLDAASGFDVWRKSEINGQTYVVDALFRRRTAEKALFLRPTGRAVAAPRFDIPPVEDQEVTRAQLSQPLPIYADPETQSRENGRDAPSYESAPTRSRRREDGPLGVLTLSERLERTDLSDAAAGETAAKLGLRHRQTQKQAQKRANRQAEKRAQKQAQQKALDFEPLSDGAIFDRAVPNHSDRPEYSQPAPDGAEPRSVSPIAEAAAEVSDRLDALIDGVKPDDVGPGGVEDLPESLIELPSDAPRSNVVKVAFGKTETAGDETFQGGQTARDDSAGRGLAANETIGENETRAAHRRAQKVKVRRAARGARIVPYLLMIMVGLALTGAAVWTMLQGSVEALGETGPVLVFGGAIIGALILMGAFYHLMRGLFAKR